MSSTRVTRERLEPAAMGRETGGMVGVQEQKQRGGKAAGVEAIDGRVRWVSYEHREGQERNSTGTAGGRGI